MPGNGGTRVEESADLNELLQDNSPEDHSLVVLDCQVDSSHYYMNETSF